jgi:hypothetical protein
MIGDILTGEKKLVFSALNLHGHLATIHMDDAGIAANHATDAIAAQETKCIAAAQRTAGTILGNFGTEQAGGQGLSDAAVGIGQENFSRQGPVDHLCLPHIGQNRFEKALDPQKCVTFHPWKSRHRDAHGRFAP